MSLQQEIYYHQTLFSNLITGFLPLLINVANLTFNSIGIYSYYFSLLFQFIISVHKSYGYFNKPGGEGFWELKKPTKTAPKSCICLPVTLYNCPCCCHIVILFPILFLTFIRNAIWLMYYHSYHAYIVYCYILQLYSQMFHFLTR